jgi:hypothetical protein
LVIADIFSRKNQRMLKVSNGTGNTRFFFRVVPLKILESKSEQYNFFDFICVLYAIDGRDLT